MSIAVARTDAMTAEADLIIEGHNSQAHYDVDQRIFHVMNPISMIYLGTEYVLHEYHYHMPGQHRINGVVPDAELHMVFAHGHFTGDICGNKVLSHSTDRVIMVCIPLMKDPAPREVDLELQPPVVPQDFFHYDTMINDMRVRMIVSPDSREQNMTEVYLMCKRGYPCAEYDGRILLHSHYEPKKFIPPSRFRSKSTASSTSEESHKPKGSRISLSSKTSANGKAKISSKASASESKSHSVLRSPRSK